MNSILAALFGSTEELKQKSRKSILAILLPLRAIEFLVGPVLSLYILISTYMSEVQAEHKVGLVAWLIGAIIIFSTYNKFTRWLKEWETNKRIKWLLLTIIKFMPILVLVILGNVIQAETEVFIKTLEGVLYAYMVSFVFGFFASPLQEELRIRDKIKLNTETGRIVD